MSVKIELEIHLFKAGDNLQSVTAFLLFLKIVIKTVISVTLLCSCVLRYSSGQYWGSPSLSKTVALALSFCEVWGWAFHWANQGLFSTYLICLALKFYCH
jgi:hypothetical protein